FSRMYVYFLRQPNGGQFSVNVNNENAQTVSTAGDADTSGFYEIKAQQPGANTFEVKTTSGNVRLFGAVIENDGPGVVYDSLGVNGAYAGLLVAAMDEKVAFFNTYQAMGGEGTMAKWSSGTGKNHLVGGDLTHPTAEGSEIVGRLIYEAINDGYTKYKVRAGNQLVAKGK